MARAWTALSGKIGIVFTSGFRRFFSIGETGVHSLQYPQLQDPRTTDLKSSGFGGNLALQSFESPACKKGRPSKH